MADTEEEVSPFTATEQLDENEEIELENEEPVDVEETSRDQEEDEEVNNGDQSPVTSPVTTNSPSIDEELPIETQLNITNGSPINHDETSTSPSESETTPPIETPDELTTPNSEEVQSPVTTSEEDKLQATPTMPPTPTASNKENTRFSSQKKPPSKKMTPIRSQSTPSVGGAVRPSTKGSPADSGRRKSSGKKTFQPTVPKPFNFCLEQRLEERGDYEKKMKSMRVALEEKEKRDKERRQKEEEEEIKSIRKTLIHKARPIQYYNPITVVPSEKPLTVPEPPNLQLGNRNRAVRDRDSTVPLKQVL